jgi:hypothetical protein
VARCSNVWSQTSFRNEISLFWGVKQCGLVVGYRRFVTTYRSHLEGSRKWHRKVCVVSFIRHEGDEVCTILRYYAAHSGNYLPTFRDNLCVPEERRYRTDRLSRNVSSYQSTLQRNLPEERKSNLNRGGSVKSSVRNDSHFKFKRSFVLHRI